MITTIKRKIDSNKLYGFVVSESDKYLLIAKEHDFIFDGYQIIRKSDITDRYISESNKYSAKIMRNEGLWINYIPKWVKQMDLSNWMSIIKQIKCSVIIIENERKNGEFYIGPIIGVTTTAVTLRWFSGTGKWGEPDKITYAKITTCKFLDRYSTIHSKYLKPSQQVVAPEPALLSNSLIFGFGSPAQ